MVGVVEIDDDVGEVESVAPFEVASVAFLFAMMLPADGEEVLPVGRSEALGPEVAGINRPPAGGGLIAERADDTDTEADDELLVIGIPLLREAGATAAFDHGLESRRRTVFLNCVTMTHGPPPVNHGRLAA